MTEMDKKLQAMAAENWEQFASLIGEPALIEAKACLLRQNKWTYGEIQNKLGITYKQARSLSDKCKERGECS